MKRSVSFKCFLPKVSPRRHFAAHPRFLADSLSLALAFDVEAPPSSLLSVTEFRFYLATTNLRLNLRAALVAPLQTGSVQSRT